MITISIQNIGLNLYLINRETHAVQQIEQARIAHRNEVDLFNANNCYMVEIAQRAITQSVIINGGALVALAALIGSLINGSLSDKALAQTLAHSMVWFAYGLGLAGISFLFVYFTSLCAALHGQKRPRIWKHPYVVDTKGTNKLHFFGELARLLATILAVASLGSNGHWPDHGQ